MKNVFVALLYVSLSILNAASAYGQSRGERPNIVFVLTDDQRWDAVGYAGNSIIHTPEIDKLAAAGVTFTKAFVTTPICAASRASILTGLHERTHGYTFQVANIRDEDMEMSYPRVIRNSGYYTGFFGKLGVNNVPADDLFDVHEIYDRNPKFKDRRGYFYQMLNGDTVHLTRYTGERALEFIELAPRDRPFCLSVNFSAPHGHDPAEEQYFWDPEDDDLYADIAFEDPRSAEQPYFDALPSMVKEGFNRLRWTWRFDTPEKYDRSIKGYYRMISGIDREVGRIRQELKKNGLDKNTIIIYMADNGYFLGDRQIADKWLMYDNSVRVPLVIYDPRQGSGGTVSEMVLNIDVPPTILQYAGLQPPARWQGKALVPLVEKTTKNFDRDTIFLEHLWEMVSIPPSEGVRTATWKYFRYINDKSIEELYDLTKDPLEHNNLADQRAYRKVLKTLREKCDDYIAKYSRAAPTMLRTDFTGDGPEYSWAIPVDAESQKGYQILVSSSKQNIDLNIGDVWNSQQVRSEQSAGIQHEGKSLISGRKYYWKARVWDHDNRLTEYSAIKELVNKR